MKSLILVFISLFLIGCSPQALIVTKRGMSANPNRPMNEAQSKGGTSKYLADSTSGREEAYSKMKTTCGGPYKITKENVTHESFDYVDLWGTTRYSTHNVVYLDFECVDHS